MNGEAVKFDGAFSASDLSSQSKTYGAYTSSASLLRFDASQASAIYLKSHTVQPNAITVQYLIKY